MKLVTVFTVKMFSEDVIHYLLYKNSWNICFSLVSLLEKVTLTRKRDSIN